jgi:hypothetical protein
MTSRTLAPCRPTSVGASVLGVVACVMAALALCAAPALAAGACPNEQLRRESDINPSAGEPYSVGLPDCRAYEMVSPLYKQSSSAKPITIAAGDALPVAPSGETVGFDSEGDFAEPENFKFEFKAANMYLSARGPSGWSTRSAFPPHDLVDDPFEDGLDSDSSLDLRGVRASCGENDVVVGGRFGQGVVCAAHNEAQRAITVEHVASTSGSTTVTVASGGFPGVTDGMSVTGSGIPLETVVSSVDGNSLTLSYEATATGASVTLTFSTEPDEWEATPTWEHSPTYKDVNGSTFAGVVEDYSGGSADLSRVFLQPTYKLLEEDVEGSDGGAGIYEIAGLGGQSQVLRLVNVDNEGHVLTSLSNEQRAPALLGNWRPDPIFYGSDYHAVSASGETALFTASPVGSEVQAVFARVHCVKGELEHPSCREDGNKEEFETVSVSNPTPADCSECLQPITVEDVASTSGSTTVKVASGEFPGVTEGMSVAGPGIPFETVVSSVNGNSLTLSHEATATTGAGAGVTLTFSELQSATFVGASADGSKVFFTTQQRLLSKEPDDNADGKPITTPNLYEYDFDNPAGHKLVLISSVPSELEGANVTGVVSTSSDGSHVYFVAGGELTTEPNEYGESASAGGRNLYGYDTADGKVKFITKMNSGTEDAIGNGSKNELAPNSEEDHAQATPDGRYLLFSTVEHLAGANTGASAVYRYDFQTGQLTWVSHAAPGFTPAGSEDKKADVGPQPRTYIGAYANIDDWNRSISENGEYVIFDTREKLQPGVEGEAPKLYEWHCSSPCDEPAREGTVGMIVAKPGGVNESANEVASMSASGSDIFFSVSTQLVPQDADSLTDVYDARIDGGYPAPPTVTSIEPEQGSISGGQEVTIKGSGFVAGATVSIGTELTDVKVESLSEIKAFTPAEAAGSDPVKVRDEHGTSSGGPVFTYVGSPSEPGATASSVASAGGNLTAPLGGSLAFQVSAPAVKPLTRAQQLAKALKSCKAKKAKKQRVACESQAKKKYAPKPKAKGKAKAKKSDRGGK